VLYGSEITFLTKTERKGMERVQFAAAKKVLRTSVSTCDEAVRGDLGLREVSVEGDRRKLLWWGKVQKMGQDRLVKQVAGLEWKCSVAKRKIMWKDGMGSLIAEYRLEEAAEEVESMSESRWRAVVDKKVEDVEQEMFRTGIQGKSKLDLYGKLKDKMGFEGYLAGFQRGGQRQMFKFRSGSTGLGEDRGHWKSREYGMGCKLCGGEEEQTREHVIFDCSGYTDLRAEWEITMGRLVDGWDSLSRGDKLVILLSQPLSLGSKTKSSDDVLGVIRTASLNYLLVLMDTRIQGMYGDTRYQPPRISSSRILSVCRLSVLPRNLGGHGTNLMNNIPKPFVFPPPPQCC
jgi:hypothetical protein